MGYGWLNLGSILLGIIALAVPFRGIAAEKKWKPRLAVSAAACAAAIGLQALYRMHQVSIGDWAGLADTEGLAEMASVFLLVLTVLINLIMVRAHRSVRQ